MRTGSAKLINPLSTNPIKKIGRSTTENTILEIPHVARIANKRIFPNTTNIKIVNKNVNTIYVPPLFLFLLREMWIYLQALIFYYRNFVYSSFRSED